MAPLPKRRKTPTRAKRRNKPVKDAQEAIGVHGNDGKEGKNATPTEFPKCASPEESIPDRRQR
jgi:hypothetical protein